MSTQNQTFNHQPTSPLKECKTSSKASHSAKLQEFWVTKTHFANLIGRGSRRPSGPLSFPQCSWPGELRSGVEKKCLEAHSQRPICPSAERWLEASALKAKHSKETRFKLRRTSSNIPLQAPSSQGLSCESTYKRSGPCQRWKVMSLLTLAEKPGPKEALLGNQWQPRIYATAPWNSCSPHANPHCVQDTFPSLEPPKALRSQLSLWSHA